MKKLFNYIKYLLAFYFSHNPAQLDNEVELDDENNMTPIEPTEDDEDEPIIEDTPIEEPMSNKNYSNVIVCLDNGHGEETPGKRSPYSAKGIPPKLPFREYQYCREIVERLKNELVELGFEVFVVTPETWDVKLTPRANRVNQVASEAKKEGKHTLMISVHNNAAGNGDAWKEAYGWSAWTTKGKTNSDKLADSLYKAAEEVLLPLNQKIRKDFSDGDPDYEENFTIIYKSNCPAVLTENMFQDCIKEVEFLLSEEGRAAIVEIHKRGIIDFCEKMEWC